MLTEIVSRILAELGPWLWMVGGFFLIAVEIVLPSGIALGFGLAAVSTGAVAILGESGSLPAWPVAAQFGVWLLLSLTLTVLIKRLTKAN